MLDVRGKVSMEDVHVVEDDGFFSLITVPPLVKWFEVGIGIRSVGGPSFPATAEAIYPDPASSVQLIRSDHVVPSDGLEGGVMPDSELGINEVKFS